MSTAYLDISQALSDGLPVWPGDPEVLIARLPVPDATQAGNASVSHLGLGTHSGTHVDPPAHFFPNGATVDQLQLDLLIGPAWVAHVPGPGPVTAEALADAAIPPETERLLIRSANSERAHATFDADFVGLSPAAGDWLLGRGIRLVGIDGPSIEPFGAGGSPVHRALLGAGVIVVENLLLVDVPPGSYRLICLPLRIAGGDGAPARAILIRDA